MPTGKKTTKKKATKKVAKKKNPLLEEPQEVEVEETPEVEVKKAEPKKINAKEALDSDISRTKAILDKQEKVHFMVPLAEGEDVDAVHTVTINGYAVDVPKGIMTKVPQSVADQLANHYQIGSEVGRDMRLDLNAEKRNALS